MVALAQLIDLCDKTYSGSLLVAGKDGRDGANVFTLPSGEIVLCFRGTLVNHNLQSALDWVTDLHAHLVSAEGFPGKVHHGFLTSLDALWPAVMAALEDLQPKAPCQLKPWWQCCWFGRSEKPKSESPLPWNKKLTITGHSKGGALASLAAVRLKHLCPQVRTFGAPMVGDLQFSVDYPHEIDLIRYEHNFDFVPFLPGRWAGYREIGYSQTQHHMPRHLREIAVGKLIAEGQWEQIHRNHALATGYRPWLTDEKQAVAEAA